MSILDQVRKNKFKDNITAFSPTETLTALFSNLNDKEIDVIKRRFGLGMERKYTLEEIGQHYGITRERVRQIENLTIKKLKEMVDLRQELKEAELLVSQLLEQYGGVMEEEFFLENVLSYINADSEHKNTLLFLAEHIFSDNVNKMRQDKEFNNLWKLNNADVDLLKGTINQLVKIIENEGKSLKLADLLVCFRDSDFYKENKDKIFSLTTLLEATEEDVDKILESYLRASRRIKQDIFSDWGLVSWGIVQPRKINDKIYLVLKKSGKPLHFTDIATLINENGFDDKKAYPPTVHNELILDDKYILVGRGIYALKEWGYKAGNVADVIEDVIEENGPMTKEEIINKVLDKRNVKRSTVYLSLMNHPRLSKSANGRYSLKEKEVVQDEEQETVKVEVTQE
ncbi:MAG: sigma factor-like helix-turn-helix DNA-binding protein [Patescibacteria group bacterium]